MNKSSAFTLLEVLISLFILMLLTWVVTSSWIGLLRAEQNSVLLSEATRALETLSTDVYLGQTNRVIMPSWRTETHHLEMPESSNAWKVYHVIPSSRPSISVRLSVPSNED